MKKITIMMPIILACNIVIYINVYSQTPPSSPGTVYGKIVSDPIGTEKIAAQIIQFRDLIQQSKETVNQLQTVNNEINGMRGQLMNAYNQSFGFIGEANGLKEDLIDYANEFQGITNSIQDNIKCLIGSDLTTLQKQETLLKARTIDYTDSKTQRDLVNKGDTSFFEKYLGASVRIPRNVKNLSKCGSITTDAARIKFDQFNKMYKEAYGEEILTDVSKLAEMDKKNSKKYKTSEQLLSDFLTTRKGDTSQKTVAQLTGDQLELLTIIANSTIDIAKYSKNMLILDLDQVKDSVYSDYARSLYQETEVSGAKNVGLPKSASKKAEDASKVVSNSDPSSYYKFFNQQ